MDIIITSMLVWAALMAGFVVAILWIADICERAYNFFWKVHDEED